VIETRTDTPYGMNTSCTGTDVSPMHFTGKQKDTESGNDYFGARYLASGTNLGRFMTPDWASDGSPVPYAKLDNPQTLNLYVYLRNNPLNTIDPDGHEPPNTGQPCTDTTGCNTQLSRDNKGTPTQPVNSVTILGKEVKVDMAGSMSAGDQMKASDAIVAAAAAINSNANNLSDDQKAAIGQISTVSFTNSSKAYEGATGNHTMTLSIGYLTKFPVTASWLGSLVGHEGQHYRNSGKYKGAEMWKNEQSARRMQLGIGNKIGFLRYEREYLETHSGDAYQEEMQKHMEQGRRD